MTTRARFLATMTALGAGAAVPAFAQSTTTLKVALSPSD